MEYTEYDVSQLNCNYHGGVRGSSTAGTSFGDPPCPSDPGRISPMPFFQYVIFQYRSEG